MLLEQIREICNLLAANNIYPVLLKGAGNLMDDLYQDIGERIMGDIDILVKEEDYHRAAEIAMNFGYQVTESEYFYDDVDILKHYPRLGHPERYAALEIHRLPVEEKYTRLLNQKMIREKAKKRKLTRLLCTLRRAQSSDQFYSQPVSQQRPQIGSNFNARCV